MNSDKNERLKSLNRQRGAMKAKLTSFRIFLEALENRDSIEEHEIINFEQRIDRIEELIVDYDACQGEIEQLTDESTIEECFMQRAEFEANFYEWTAKAQKRFNDLKPDTGKIIKAESELAARGLATAYRKIKLTQLKLPQFDGSYDKWPKFHDMFKSLIHSDKQIDTIAKFQYLQGSLSGEALTVLDGLDVLEANYEAAWELLVKRYQNKGLMIHKHIEKIVEHPKILKENHEYLRKLVDAMRGHMRALTALEQSVESWDRLLIYLISGKLAASSKNEWEKEIIEQDELPDIQSFFNFLEKRCQLLEKTGKHVKVANETQSTRPTSKHNSTVLAHASTTKGSCILCGESHALFVCKSFLEMSVSARIEQVKTKKACLNCLRLGHIAINCKSQKCCKCGKSHNTLLHLGEVANDEKSKEEEKRTLQKQGSDNEAKEVVATHVAIKTPIHSTLPTAMVEVVGGAGQTLKCNVLLDSGSQSNFMTTNICAKLGLRTTNADICVLGINQIESKVFETTKTKIKSMHCDFEELVFMVVPKITSRLPSEPLKFRREDISSNVSLVDPDFHKPKKIDLLVGIDLFWNIFEDDSAKYPYLRKTKLGYVVAGKLPSRDNHRRETRCHIATHEDDLSCYLQQFWEVEELPSKRLFSSEEQACEIHFTESTKRDNEGRFIVSIPFKASINELGDSREIAERRLKSLERRLQKDEKMRSQYAAFLREYEELGHMTKIAEDNTASIACYLPHHGVVKESSLTTKLRVVFNASSPTSTGVSINDLQMVGPTIQRELLSILLSFRQHPYVIGADITRMYRHVLIEPTQRSLQRILWRERPEDPIIEYQLNTITYGMTASAFLAIRCLFSLAEEHQSIYPEAANIIKDHMYVDDLLFGAPTREKAIRLATDVSHILAAGCFELRKWISNDPETIANIDKSNCVHDIIKIGGNESTKTLGLSWSSAKDELVYQIEVEPGLEPTKRFVSAMIARIYDPLGLLGPSIIIVKMILQQLWRSKLSWDDPLPTEMHCCAPRPVKALTTPKLELTAAHLMVKLMNKVKASLSLNIDKVYYWSDSSIVLGWIRMEPYRLQTFVRNRVVDIQASSAIANWRHVPSADNPADLASRGVSPKALADRKLCWNG
ncbi:PREDICTED: uncharacterized protein LOC108782026 [Cyphomyrmex costatus]|uniref:uncharacterized protein LOC108782026 n=1 Tax=Cyphomyrmex costatus TaxID=456900 RepID=UPI0008522298|nr:PREDICTED: uncharacterized protein LOC108782026 [Cyphomyrmex costatus]